MKTTAELEKRLEEINYKIGVAKCWGAVLTAMNEERAGILAELGRRSLEHKSDT